MTEELLGLAQAAKYAKAAYMAHRGPANFDTPEEMVAFDIEEMRLSDVAATTSAAYKLALRRYVDVEDGA